jgi:hypothetical protein
MKDMSRPRGIGLRLYGRPGPDRRDWFIRPDDLLVFDLDYVNMRIDPSVGEQPAHLVNDQPGPAYIIVTLPPQHLAEVAYFTTDSPFPVVAPATDDRGQKTPPDPDAGALAGEKLGTPPICALITSWSRLVFIVPDDHAPIELTSNGVLGSIRDLELSVPVNALPPADTTRFSSLLFAELRSAAASLGILPDVPSSATLRSGGSSSFLAAAHEQRMIRMAAHLHRVQEGALGGDIIDRFARLPSSVIPPGLLRPEPRAPTSTETAIELPYKLVLSPNKFAAWVHSDLANTSAKTGRTEMWHTRLGTRDDNGEPVEGASPMRTLRAVWSKDDTPPTTPKWGTVVSVPSHDPHPFRMSLDIFDRHNIVHLSSNFGLAQWNNPKRFYEPAPIDVELLALSALGGWLDSRGSWQDQPLGLSVEEWRHRATLGRDHYVRVVYGGRLFPLGHRASIVKVSERQFDESSTGNPAYLRQEMFLIVREPVRSYRSSGLIYAGSDPLRLNERFDLKLPFTTARITTLVSPLLDDPVNTEIDKGLAQSAFWPYVGGLPFCFHVVAQDMESRPVDLVMPLIFIGQELSDRPYYAIVPTTVCNNYATKPWPGSEQLLATVPLGGQRIAFAPSRGRDETTFATRELTFAGEVPSEEVYNDKLSRREPRYVPTIVGAKIDVPSIQAIAKTTDPASVIFDHTYLSDGFVGTNKGETFLAADPDPFANALAIPFSKQADRSGGLVAPDMSLAGVSRIIGPVSGDLATATSANFDAGKWFGAITDAQLFGAVKLKDIIQVATFDDLDQIPRFTGGLLDPVRRLVTDLERLKRVLSGNVAAEIATTSMLLGELADPDTGSLNALSVGGNVGDVINQLVALKAELHVLPARLASSSLAAGPMQVASEAATSLEKAIGELLANPQLLTDFAGGLELPEVMTARFEWRPVALQTDIFKPKSVPGGRNLILSVEAAGDDFVVTCSLDQFTLDLTVLLLTFEHVQFRTRAGKKPDIDVVFGGFEFEGPLSFVQTLQELIPLSGFSDPPSLQVTDEGISAGFSMGLPNIAIGVFSLENLSLAAGFAVPFLGQPLTTWFRFCERENPARLTVTLFGGGFFFGVTVDAHGLQIAEGAIEFGAAISVDLGVASGSVSAMAGLYFKLESTDVTLAGYFRLRGQVEALGIVSICIELYLEMRYETASHKCVGTATISVEIDVALFSTSISITCTKKFAGSGSDPTLAEALDVAADGTSKDWNLYCAAFAA